VVSVDYHVAQYAKIVEDLKVEIQQLKDKIVPLEDENQALRNQVSVVKLPRRKKRGRWTLTSIDSSEHAGELFKFTPLMNRIRQEN